MAWARKVTKAFEEEGLAKGSASVGVDGQMIDTPVYRDGLNILARVKEIEEAEAAKEAARAAGTAAEEAPDAH